jgi:hypothetical protein
LKIIENLLYAFVVVLSFALTGIALASFLRTRKGKLLLVALAFIFFLVKGVILTLELSFDLLGQEGLLIALTLIDVAILLTIFFAMFKS